MNLVVAQRHGQDRAEHRHRRRQITEGLRGQLCAVVTEHQRRSELPDLERDRETRLGEQVRAHPSCFGDDLYADRHEFGIGFATTNSRAGSLPDCSLGLRQAKTSLGRGIDR
ncbi:hypothetical protein [Nocardia fluminea]|uniref:hypothetical protein n=1 Tax=Nocardia fluminea TaxID=134984 RepID=UPI00364701F6